MNNYIYAFLISMVPVIELRGAIPLGIAWGLEIKKLFVVCILGNILPVPFLIVFARKILLWGKDKKYIGKFCNAIIDNGNKKINKIMGPIQIALFAFVAIPLPGTGAWTGSLIATLLGMPVKKAILPISLGVIAAGLIMSITTYGIISIVK